MSIGLSQVHSELRRSASFRKGWNRSCVLIRYEQREEKLDLGMKPLRDLAGECARGRPEGLYRGRVRDMKDQEGV